MYHFQPMEGRGFQRSFQNQGDGHTCDVDPDRIHELVKESPTTCEPLVDRDTPCSGMEGEKFDQVCCLHSSLMCQRGCGVSTDNTMRTVNQGGEYFVSRMKQEDETIKYVMKTEWLHYRNTHNITTNAELSLPVNEYSALAIVHATNITKTEIVDTYGQVRRMSLIQPNTYQKHSPARVLRSYSRNEYTTNKAPSNCGKVDDVLRLIVVDANTI